MRLEFTISPTMCCVPTSPDDRPTILRLSCRINCGRKILPLRNQNHISLQFTVGLVVSDDPVPFILHARDGSWGHLPIWAHLSRFLTLLDPKGLGSTRAFKGRDHTSSDASSTAPTRSLTTTTTFLLTWFPPSYSLITLSQPPSRAFTTPCPHQTSP